MERGQLDFFPLHFPKLKLYIVLKLNLVLQVLFEPEISYIVFAFNSLALFCRALQVFSFNKQWSTSSQCPHCKLYISTTLISIMHFTQNIFKECILEDFSFLVQITQLSSITAIQVYRKFYVYIAICQQLQMYCRRGTKKILLQRYLCCCTYKYVITFYDFLSLFQSSCVLRSTQSFISSHGLKWHFDPLLSPWWRGIFERMAKSSKISL